MLALRTIGKGGTGDHLVAGPCGRVSNQGRVDVFRAWALPAWGRRADLLAAEEWGPEER